MGSNLELSVDLDTYSNIRILNRPGVYATKSAEMAAINWSQHEAKRLVRFKEAGQPITDRSYWVGRYVLCPLRMRGTTAEGERVEIEFPDAVAAVSRERHIVSTALVGRNGTVKEYINDGDWQVNIVVGVQAIRDGVIADEWPAEELLEVEKLLGIADSLEVVSEFLKVFGITRIVVKSHSVSQTTEANYQAVSVSAVSDEEYEIYSNEY